MGGGGVRGWFLVSKIKKGKVVEQIYHWSLPAMPDCISTILCLSPLFHRLCLIGICDDDKTG